MSDNYKSNVVMEFNAKNVKDISELAMDVQFPEAIGQFRAASGYLIQTGKAFKVIENDGVGNILLKEVIK